ncbi:unnamed protein product [Rhizophagus irregularis]|nr:unnamed protein product [Rhizophagus irregularis]
MKNEQDLTLEDSYWQDDNDIYGNYDENPYESSLSEDLNENLSEISNKTSSNNSDENLNEVSNTNLSDNSGENLSETSNAKLDENISSIESDDDKNYDTIETMVIALKFKVLFYMDPTATLPSNAKAARVFFDLIEISYILYKKMIIIEYNQIQYILHHRTIFDAIKELLSNKEIFKYCIFDYNSDYIMNDKGEQKHCYSELYNNATTCNTLRKKTEYSVFLILGNIPSWRRNKPDAKALLAYLHKINDHQKKHVMAKYQLFQCLMNILVIKSIMSVMSDVKLLAENKKAIIEMSDGLDLRTDDGIL